MTKEIDIQIERENHGDWIRICMPHQSRGNMLAIFQNDQGEIIKRVKLAAGSNAIDISHISNPSINLKIETPYQTICKKLILSES